MYICPSVILIDFVFRTGKTSYSQVLLKECKYIVKEKKLLDYITDDIEIFSGDSDKQNSDEENSIEEISNIECI